MRSRGVNFRKLSKISGIIRSERIIIIIRRRSGIEGEKIDEPRRGFRRRGEGKKNSESNKNKDNPINKSSAFFSSEEGEKAFEVCTNVVVVVDVVVWD